jgi:hygromycin-B 7''-O-kinase
MARDFYVQPDAADPVLDPDTVLAIVRRHAPAAKAVAAVDEHGGEARTYAIDDDLTLKVQRPQQLRPRTSLAKERFVLRQLANVEGVRVPQVIGGGVAEPAIEYTLMTRMPGVAIGDAGLVGESRRRALFDLGGMLRRIHAIPQQPLFDARVIPGDHTPADVRWRFGNLFDEAAASLDRAPPPWPLAHSPLQLARLAMCALPDVDQWVALHSNPGPEHVFVDHQTGQLTGIIDFGDAYFSHPVHDLRRFRCRADRAAVYAGYTAEGAVSENFNQTWRVACVLAGMLAVAHEPQCRAAALQELSALFEKTH